MTQIGIRIHPISIYLGKRCWKKEAGKRIFQIKDRVGYADFKYIYLKE
jgi:hypothetical protein